MPSCLSTLRPITKSLYPARSNGLLLYLSQVNPTYFSELQSSDGYYVFLSIAQLASHYSVFTDDKLYWSIDSKAAGTDVSLASNVYCTFILRGLPLTRVGFASNIIRSYLVPPAPLSTKNSRSQQTADRQQTLAVCARVITS